ncbi:uncharacterized protein LOC144116989 [Amblyomma americanum]
MVGRGRAAGSGRVRPSGGIQEPSGHDEGRRKGSMLQGLNQETIGVSSIPVALVPSDGGAIRLNNPEAVQAAVQSTSKHFLRITDIRQFGRGGILCRSPYKDCIEDLLKCTSFANHPAGGKMDLQYSKETHFVSGRRDQTPYPHSPCVDNAARRRGLRGRQLKAVRIHKCLERSTFGVVPCDQR